ncbi:hypothetical protein [Streptomyces sp. NPDC057257]|uniref:hypothetical protein n=1 Tax=Streptomyces sp. NPDC057257 TaxID=3346071 RepID=UPI00363D7A7C
MRVWIAIWTGSSAIAKAIGDWIRGGAVVLKLLAVFAAAGFIKGLPWTTYIVSVLAQAWLFTAVYLGLRLPDPTKPNKATAKAEQQDQEAEQDQEAPKEAAQPSHTDVVTALHTLLKDTGGVHLQDLAKALPHGPWKTGDVRSLLASHSIRVRPGVRVPGVGPREGVHRDDVPPLPHPDEPTPAVADVGAGHSDNNNGNNTEPEIVQDEDNPQRWHVLPRRVRALAPKD